MSMGETCEVPMVVSHVFLLIGCAHPYGYPSPELAQGEPAAGLDWGDGKRKPRVAMVAESSV